MSQTHRITVSVGEDAIQVEPEVLTMKVSHEVAWAGKGPGRFSIEFDSDRAFGRRAFGHDDATRVQKPRAAGRFKYTVVSEANPTLKLDPVIIVEEPPTGNP